MAKSTKNKKTNSKKNLQRTPKKVSSSKTGKRQAAGRKSKQKATTTKKTTKTKTKQTSAKDKSASKKTTSRSTLSKAGSKKKLVNKSNSLPENNVSKTSKTKSLLKTSAMELGRTFGNNITHPLPTPKLKKMSQMENKVRYSDEELKEFEEIILEKLEKARLVLKDMKEMLSKKNDEGTDNTSGTMKLLEDGADTLEKENFSQLAARQQKFIVQLENALARIKNGTYGICVDTGKLIPKERLKAVPHTQHSIEAKLNKKD